MTDKTKSVERGWVELLSGLGEVVTDDDTFFDDLKDELKKKFPPSNNEKLEALRCALIEGEERGFLEYSFDQLLDEINSELDDDLTSRNEDLADERTIRAMEDIRLGLSAPIDDLLEMIKNDLVLSEDWRKENKEAIVAFNDRVAKNGVFGARKRRF